MLKSDKMLQSDKELAVQFASAYVSAWFSKTNVVQPMNGPMIKNIITESYNAIHALSEDTSTEDK
ncbi:hypothetical protein EDD70_1949 [Hydrogenoanaerobacterium saccharovorans]|uniref:Uncharacterized protein n=1 Tax=Hydrogenoanaerobacterium saccharovorans TaxID=474960 RepID=A0A1H7YNV3_9FIRM|nr:hypothetical protein [Hydrogenoanaerobacterium saccharovorans]RPF49111.1 hypothetical protein EDD70_1949 [Hydrogenoanaerobacterium saccharovorans]SEM47643.1 hypothetical protein SAMN05216180_0146 [Hydrogenoanaerobacterium saccharovorans]